MKISSGLAALLLAASLAAAPQANAFFSADRPPPNGMNGISAKGFSIAGVTTHQAGFDSIVLPDGRTFALK